MHSYGAVIGKAKLREDDNSQWRRMAWSEDSQVLAVSYSTGAVTMLDIMCGEFLTVNEVRFLPVDILFCRYLTRWHSMFYSIFYTICFKYSMFYSMAYWKGNHFHNCRKLYYQLTKITFVCKLHLIIFWTSSDTPYSNIHLIRILACAS